MAPSYTSGGLCVSFASRMAIYWRRCRRPYSNALGAMLSRRPLTANPISFDQRPRARHLRPTNANADLAGLEFPTQHNRSSDASCAADSEALPANDAVEERIPADAALANAASVARGREQTTHRRGSSHGGATAPHRARAEEATRLPVATGGAEAVGAEEAVGVCRPPMCRLRPTRMQLAKRSILQLGLQLPRKGSNGLPALKQGCDVASRSFKRSTSPRSFAVGRSRCKGLRANCVARCATLSAPA